jgi:predicted nucleotide-binding protein (sugar kinase/HSP70/actin superfamily)
MGKTIPVKAKAKKKRKAEIEGLMSAEAQRKAERKLQKFVMELDERSEERAKWVNEILKANDDDVAHVLRIMVETLKHMEGPPKIVFEGKPYNAVKGETELLERIQERNFAWVAMRCLVACAEWNIQVGNFKLPKDLCARCGVKVKKKAGKKKHAH